MTSVAIDVGQMKNIAIGVVVVLLLVAVLSAMLIRAVVGKVVALVIIVGLGIVVWTQRAALGDCAETCDCSFFGYDLAIDDPDIRARCEDLAGTVS